MEQECFQLKKDKYCCQQHIALTPRGRLNDWKGLHKLTTSPLTEYCVN